MQEAATLYGFISFCILPQFSLAKPCTESRAASLKFLQFPLQTQTGVKTCIQAKIPLALLHRNDYNSNW
jgi:hypothetical protein